MIKKISWAWEKLDENTYRAKVIGGWVLHHTICDGIASKPITRSESMIFIADSDHQWQIVAAFDPSNPGTKHTQSTVKASDFESPSK